MRKTNKRGRGVFATGAIDQNTLLEVAPVIVMSSKDRKELDKTLLHDYIFEWGPRHRQCCMALGYVALYNHSYEANCEYEMDYGINVISVKTIRPVLKGEELTINYNGEWNNETEVWFDAK